MNTLKVITPDNLGKGITFNPQTKQWEASSGLDCASIDNLPEKPWKKGTTLLAKQDGECVRLASLDSIFQEIGVGIAADKTSAFTGETYNVTVTVTNTGESKNELTNLTVQKPLLGNYEILDVRTSKQGVDEVEALDDLNYNLKGLAKGGTFILRFSVKANDVGTYQFTATVNPNSALDQNAKNNTDTIILKANTKIDTTYVPSVDCPRITATELDSNTVLSALTPDSNGAIYNYVGGRNSWNVFAERDNLKGLRIRLDGASTAIIFSYNSGFGSYVVELSNGRLMYTGSNGANPKVDFNAEQTPDDGFTFIDGVLEFTKDSGAYVIMCRPAGKNCRWQAFGVVGSSVPVSKRLAASNITNAEVSYISNYPKTDSFPINSNYNIVPSSVTYNQYTRKQVDNKQYRVASIAAKLVIKVKSGQAASITITPSTGGIKIPYTQGKTTITENLVTVAADATSTDSINSEYLQVIVED